MTMTELLNSMQNRGSDNVKIGGRSLSNTKETWQRIAEKDSFDELGFTDDSEKEKFLSDWCSENPYNNIA